MGPSGCPLACTASSQARRRRRSSNAASVSGPAANPEHPQPGVIGVVPTPPSIEAGPPAFAEPPALAEPPPDEPLPAVPPAAATPPAVPPPAVPPPAIPPPAALTMVHVPLATQLAPPSAERAHAWPGQQSRAFAPQPRLPMCCTHRPPPQSDDCVHVWHAPATASRGDSATTATAQTASRVFIRVLGLNAMEGRRRRARRHYRRRRSRPAVASS